MQYLKDIKSVSVLLSFCERLWVTVEGWVVVMVGEERAGGGHSAVVHSQ